MRDGIEQGGFQTFALPLRFSLAELLDSTRALDSDGYQRAQSFQGLTRELGSGNS